MKPNKRERGEGRVFQDRYRDRTTREWRTCETWTIRWYAGGRHHKEGGFESKKEAREELRSRLEASKAGLYVPGANRTTFEDLANLLVTEYKANERRSIDRAEDAVAHLREFFDGYTAKAITTPRILDYIKARQEARASNATINRELAAVKRMFRLGMKSGKVARCPWIDLLQENNTRKGFFEEPEFRAVLSHLPEDLQPVYEVAYLTGWRVKS